MLSSPPNRSDRHPRHIARCNSSRWPHCFAATLALATSASATPNSASGAAIPSALPYLIGVTSNRQLGVLALRYGHSIYDSSNIPLQYTLDIVPIEFISQPKYVVLHHQSE